MAVLWSEVLTSIRSLRRAPGFVLTSLLTLVLGISASTAIFAVVNGVLLRPLGIPDAGSLVVIWETDRRLGGSPGRVSSGNFLEWRRQASSFSSMGLFQLADVFFRSAEGMERISAAVLSPEVFFVLGVKPAFGRLLAAEDQIPGGEDVVVVSYAFWQQRLGGRPDVVGQSIAFPPRVSRVVGILPPDFQFFRLFLNDPQVFAPVPHGPGWDFRDNPMYTVLAKLKPGVQKAQAEAEMKVIAAKLEQEFPKTNAGLGVALIGLREQVVGRWQSPLVVLLMAAVLVLAVASSNLATLLLTRASAKRRESAIRLALGATPLGLVREQLAEALVLSVFGGTGAVALAGVALKAFAARLAPHLAMARLDQVTVDRVVLAFAILAALASCTVGTVASALGVVRFGMRATTGIMHAQQEAGGIVGLRSRRILVASQLALATTLLVAAGLTVLHIRQLQSRVLGYNYWNVLTMRVWLPHTGAHTSPSSWREFFDRLFGVVGNLPGVQAVAGAFPLPTVDEPMVGFRPADQPVPASGGARRAKKQEVSPGYFRAMQMPLLRGRAFTGSEECELSEPVVVSAAAASQYWPGQDPVGKALKIPYFPKTHTVVGVVGETWSSVVKHAPVPTVYICRPGNAKYLLVRSRGDPRRLAAAISRVVRGMEKEATVDQISTLDDILFRPTVNMRVQSLLLTVFSVVALLLSVVGIYGVVACSTTLRTKEFGIRLALGARSRDILGLVLRQGVSLGLVGVAIGLAVASALGRLSATLLHGTRGADPLLLLGVCVLVGCACLVACYIPARRAAMTDPSSSLRHE